MDAPRLCVWQETAWHGISKRWMEMRRRAHDPDLDDAHDFLSPHFLYAPL